MGRLRRRDPALALLHAAAEDTGSQWSRIVIWSSGIGTFAAILGIVIGIWMYSPSKRYRYAGAPTSIPYRGQKRWHTIFGLIFGLGAATWAFSGMLSMDPFPTQTGGPAGGGGRRGGGPGIPQALRGRGSQLAAFARQAPARGAGAARRPARQGTGAHVLRRRAGLPGDAGAAATRASSRSTASRSAEFDRQRIIDVVTKAARAERRRRDQRCSSSTTATTSIGAASVRCR